MLVKHKYYAKSNPIIWVRPVLWMVYAALIAVAFEVFRINLTIPMAIPSILGTAISLFLGFRTNSAYQRWWEARKVWGEIINNSRTLTRQILHFGNKEDGTKIRERIIRRQIAWNWSLANSLRELNWQKGSEGYLELEEIQSLNTGDNVPNLILLHQENDLKQLVDEGHIDDFYFRKADETLKLLCDSMGKCERIKKTVFPTQYALFTLVFINLFLLLLPLGIVGSIGWFCIPIQIAIGFTFGMIQSIAESMQNPFDNSPNDIPMFAISRTVERNLLEMMKKTPLPPSVEAENGVLM